MLGSAMCCGVPQPVPTRSTFHRSMSSFAAPFTGRIDEKYSVRPSGETNGSKSAYWPENDAVVAGPQPSFSLMRSDVWISERSRVAGHQPTDVAHQACVCDGVKVRRQSQYASVEIAPGANFSTAGQVSLAAAAAGSSASARKAVRELLFMVTSA